MTSKIEYPNCFDFLRLYAALTVVISHATYDLKANFFLTYKEWLKWFSDGVPLFFVLSGFLVYYSYEQCMSKRNPTIQYIRNRFLRIAPAIYFYTIIISIILFILGYFTIQNYNFIWLISNIMLIPIYPADELSTFGIGALNGSLWTIPVEFSFYFFIPILYFIGKKYGEKVMLIILITTTIVGKIAQLYYFNLGYQSSLWVNLFNITFIPNMANFSMGIIILKYGDRLFKSSKNKLIFILSISLYICLKFFQREYGVNVDSMIDLMTAIPLSYIAIWLGYHLPNVFLKLTKKVGDLSYGIYIWHMPIINIIIDLKMDKYLNNNYITIFIIILTTCLMAKLSWNLIEKPCLRLKKYSLIENIDIIKK